MTDIKDVRCFQHCDRHRNIYCFSLPVICPLCGEDVTITPCRIPPYLVPSPLQNARNHPCAVIIKPTVGTFLMHYNNRSDLHVGITDSTGCAYDYNEKGVNRGTVWDQSIVIEMVKDDYNMERKWDSVLSQMSRSSSWHRSRYDENHYNCFDFVLTFLQSCDLQRSFPAIRTKHTFCEEIVVKHTHKAAVYISMYKKILKDGFMVKSAM